MTKYIWNDIGRTSTMFSFKIKLCHKKTPARKFGLLGGNTGKPLEIRMICDDGEFASKQIGSEMLKRMLDSKTFLIGGWPTTFHCC